LGFSCEVDEILCNITRRRVHNLPDSTQPTGQCATYRTVRNLPDSAQPTGQYATYRTVHKLPDRTQPTGNYTTCGSLSVSFSTTSKCKSDAGCGVFAAAPSHTPLTPLPPCTTYRPPPLHSSANNFRTLKCWVCVRAGHVAHMAAMRIT